MQIGIAQIECTLGDVATNTETICSVIRQAAAQRCELVIFPEMADTGYQMDVIREKAATWDGPPLDSIRRVAAEHGIAVGCGLSHREGDRIYNALALIDRDGRLAAEYRKTHLFSLEAVWEDRHLDAGETFTLVEIAGLRLGMMICYDIRFPEMARALSLAGAELIIVIAAWPHSRIEHWNLLNRARAIENQVYVAAANRVGQDGPMRFGGRSLLIAPFGEVLAEAPENEATLLVGQIDRDRLAQVRAAMPLFRDRRPDLYSNAAGLPPTDPPIRR